MRRTKTDRVEFLQEGGNGKDALDRVLEEANERAEVLKKR